MKHIFSLLGMFAFYLSLAAALTLAQKQPTSATVPDTVIAEGDTTKKDEKKKDEQKAFDEVIKDFKAIEGLFTLYYKEEENKVLLEIKPDQLEKIYLCSVTREAGDGRYFDSGAMVDRFPFMFKRVGKKIQFIHKNVYYRADPNSPISRAIDRGVSSSVLGSAKIESKPHPERESVLVDPGAFFLQDYDMVTYQLSERKIDFSFDKEESYFGALKSFALNTEIETVIHFKSKKPKRSNALIADNRSMQHRYRYSLSTLPETGYRPRLADDRVGHFLTMYQDYTTQTKESPYVRYIKRWHLEKADPKAKLSRPKLPIIFWLENTIPLEYRKAVKEGVLIWNKAFERIGFKDAIIVRQQPDNAKWDPADVRYSTIRWIVKPGGFYAVGPSYTNPFTGQIYDADIRISADYVRFFARSFEEFVDPLSGFSDIVTPPYLSRLPSIYACTNAEGKVHDAAFGWSLLTARGYFEPNSREAKKYVEDAIKDLVSHEVGHTLGLRHNFRASTIHTLEQLHDKDLTRKEGITGSAMDYNPINLAGKGKKQGQFWQTSLGTYDYWAIEYAYKPIDAENPEDELKELDKIAARGSEPKLAYGTDEDAFGFLPQGIDPITNLRDLGSDPIAYYEHRLELAMELVTSMESKFARLGDRYSKLRLVLSHALREYRRAAATVPKFVGGIYHRRDHIGDPGNRMPFEPVNAAKQREALTFLKQQIFGRNAFQFTPGLMRRLPPERFYDFDWSVANTSRVDYPVHDIVLSIQKIALDRMYHAITLKRMLDLPLYHKDAETVFTMVEMFQEMRKAIWSEVDEKANINSFRRNLQRAHLAKLIDLAVKPTPVPYYSLAGGTKPVGKVMPPEDASTFARADLFALQKGITTALTDTAFDVASRAHLEESLARITAALNASVQREM